MGDNVILSITILLTGFAVVFSVLLILIGIIKLYGTVIYKIQNRKQIQKASRNADLPKAVRDPEPASAVIPEEPEDDDALIAVISAAVYSMYDPSSVRVKSIRKAQGRSNAWRSAGLTEQISGGAAWRF